MSVRPFAVVAVLAVLVSGAGCAGNAASGGSTGARPAVVKLSDPGNAGVLAYAKRSGVLEQELGKVGASVQWGGSYASFTATIDAVRAGSVNVLQGATSPVIGYLANSRDIKIFSVTDRTRDPRAPHADGLVVRPDSPIRTVADLAGTRVAVNRGGRGEYLLLLALESAGVPVDRVERVYLNPNEAASAFATGKVDAWWAIVRSYPEAVAKGARVVLNSSDLDDKDVTIWAARTELLRDHPTAVAAFLRVIRDLTRQARDEPEKFQNVFLDKGPQATSGSRLADDILTARYAELPHPVTPADTANVQAVADFFVRHKLVPERFEAADVVSTVDGS